MLKKLANLSKTLKALGSRRPLKSWQYQAAIAKLFSAAREKLQTSRLDQTLSDYKNTIFLWDTCLDTVKVRLLILTLAFSLCFMGLAYRLIVIAWPGRSPASENMPSSNFRKEIIDRNGHLLAVNLPVASLFANPGKILDLEQSMQKLAKILPELDQANLRLSLQSSKSFVWVKRDLSPKQQVAIFNLGLPGFDFEHEQKRIYTFGNLLSHIIGYVGRDATGLAGLERSYDQFLTQASSRSSEPALQLSIDVRLQNILNDELEKIIQEFRAIGAVGIIANPNNGEILALVSKPDFDPHHPQKATAEQLFNMASLGTLEMGSVFKSITMAVGLDTKTIDLNDAYNLSYMKVGRFQLRDFRPTPGWHSVSEIFLHSSNIGVSQIILEIGKSDFKKYLKDLGLLDQLKIELPERSTPLFPLYNQWSDLSLVTMSYGYAISFSPLHFVQAVLPMVNGGYLYPLTLIKRASNDHLAGRRVFSQNTSEQMKKLFRLVVKDGTGRKAEVPGYLVGGKTGTAEKLANKRYVKNSRMSSFIGMFPLSKPKYVIYIMIDEPKGHKESFGFATAGWTAAPAMGKVIERIIALQGLEPVDELAPEVKKILSPNYKVDNAI